MPLNIEKILAPLREIRENLGAPLIHINQRIRPAVNPKHFLLYNPNNPNSRFHFMFCEGLHNANLQNYKKTVRTDGLFPMSDGTLNRLQVCGFCRHQWNEMFPNNPLPVPFNIGKFFRNCNFYPEAWGRILNPFRENRYVLYSPVINAPFHFMKCSDIRDKERTGWIKTYRFTPNLSGNFYVYVERTNGSFERTTQRLRPCGHCLSEWNGGRGYKNYSTANNDEKKRIMFGFNIIDFFDECAENQPELNELYELMNDNKVWFGADIRNNYPEGIWQYISRMYRIAHRYCCEQCGVDLSAYAHSHEHGNLLVVHHVNGSHPDVGANNMKVLCKECHSKQPYHENTVYRNNPASQAQRIADHNLLNDLRRAQGLNLL